MNARARQLTSLWLALVLTLLPVSGNLLAAVSPAPGEQGAPDPHIHHPHHHGGANHGAHHPDLHGPGPYGGAEQATDRAAGSLHDCHSSLCAGGCGGCAGCHAPPSGLFNHSCGVTTLTVALPVLTSTPPPGTLYRPPQHTTA